MNPSEPTKSETLRGGKSMTVRFEDGSTEVVFIRQLPLKEFETWLQVLDDEPRSAELMCGKPPGWGERLTCVSMGELIEEAERINRDFFERWLQRRTARKEWLQPLLVRNAALVSNLPIGSPNSPSKPA